MSGILNGSDRPTPIPDLAARSLIPFASRRATRALRALAVIAAVAFLVGVPLAPERAWPAFLVAGLLFTGLAAGGAAFLALHYVTGARWSTPIRRVPEAMVSALPWAGLLMLLVGFGLPVLYPWADAGTVRGDTILEGRSVWMNAPLVLLRTAVFVGAWWLLARLLVRNSRRHDLDGDPVHRVRSARVAALFLVVFGVTFSSATFDWVMSLEKHWFSTILAIYQFSGAFLSGIAAITLLVVLARRRGALARAASDDTLHDLGKLLFAFSLFWAYIGFSQYLLIWYTNSPEEVPYYVTRHGGAWAPLAVVNVLLNWAIPFTVLLPRAAKRSETVLLRVAVLVVAGRWLDLWLAVAPAKDATPVVSAWDLVLPLGALAAFLLVWRRAFSLAPPVPRGENLPLEGHVQEAPA